MFSDNDDLTAEDFTFSNEGAVTVDIDDTPKNNINIEEKLIENTVIANTIFSLFVNLGKYIEDDYTQKYKSVRHTVDSKLRRMIRQKKQSLGIRDEQSMT